LNFEREIGVHQRCPTIYGDDLACNPASFFQAEKGHGVSDVRRSQPTHRRPAGEVPSTYPVLRILWEAVQDAVLGNAGSDGIYVDAAAGQRYSEVANQ
jgi:hypothetical protein